MQVVPALLENNSESLFRQIVRLSPFFQTFQIDVADGIYVPNKTVQIEDLLSDFTGNRQIPTDKLTFDFHLMVKDYQTNIEKLAELKKVFKIKNIFVHFSLFPDFSLLTENYPQFSFGIVLNPEETVDSLKKVYDLTKVSAIQIMSVVPGFQGQPFLPDTLKKIDQLRDLGYRSNIFVDGSVNNRTIPVILSQKYKPDILVTGSYLIKAKNLQERVTFINNTINSL